MNKDLFENTYKDSIFSIQPPITIVLDERWGDISIEYQKLLDKILLSVKLSLASVRIVSHLNFKIATTSELPTKIIVFGETAETKMYEVVRKGKSKILFAHSLSHIADNQDIKLKLWSALKILFSS